MKKTILTLALLTLSFGLFAKEYTVTVNISKIKSSKGKILLAVFDSDQGFDKLKAFKEAKISAVPGTDTITITLPEGDYMFTTFHDINDNGALDKNFLKIPTEPFGFSNYDGKSIPGKFKKHKVSISSDTTLNIPLCYF